MARGQVSAVVTEQITLLRERAEEAAASRQQVADLITERDTLRGEVEHWKLAYQQMSDAAGELHKDGLREAAALRATARMLASTLSELVSGDDFSTFAVYYAAGHYRDDQAAEVRLPAGRLAKAMQALRARGTQQG